MANNRSGRIKIIYILILSFFLNTQTTAQNDSSKAANGKGYQYKLDYDIPESPAFSILDANPTNVMRGSAAKEFVVNLASNFVSKKSQTTGAAVDFNPYFVFGGRLRNINDYHKSYLKKLLANTQLSMASIATDDFPNDNLMSAGVRITLFDDFDLLKDKKLGSDISEALIPTDDPSLPGGTRDETEPLIIENEKLKYAYEMAKERLKKKKGGSMSLGAAIAKRAKSGIIHSDSLVNFRNQIWLSSQYSFGQGTNLMGMVMYRNTQLPTEKMKEFVAGIGLRHLGDKVNIGGEILYSSEKKNLEIGANLETKLLDNVLFILSVSNGSSDMLMLENNRLMIKPTLKYNLSEIKK